MPTGIISAAQQTIISLAGTNSSSPKLELSLYTNPRPQCACPRTSRRRNKSRQALVKGDPVHISVPSDSAASPGESGPPESSESPHPPARNPGCLPSKRRLPSRLRPKRKSPRPERRRTSARRYGKGEDKHDGKDKKRPDACFFCAVLKTSPISKSDIIIMIAAAKIKNGIILGCT